MGARSGEQFLQGLRSTKRHLWLDGERVDDVTAHPALAGGARTLAGIFDRLHNFPDECLIADPETGEPLNVGHMIPRSIDDLKRRNRGLARIRGGHRRPHGPHPRLHERQVRELRGALAGLARRGRGATRRGRATVAFQKRLAREDISLTHTIIHPTIDKSTDGQIVGNRVPVHRIATTSGGIVVRGARILATLAPFADDFALDLHPCPPGPRPTRSPSRYRWTRPGSSSCAATARPHPARRCSTARSRPASTSRTPS